MASRADDLVTVTGCQQFGGGVNIYITSLASEKGFSWGPYKTGAIFARNLQLVNNLLLVTDVDDHPEFAMRAGGVFIYALSPDPFSNYDFD